MVNIIIQLSKYVIIILMAIYTFSCFSIFTRIMKMKRRGC